ncbi:MAG TPA: putative 2OG-Fe(II) oxygenase [Verrucomicrobiae bacterium]|nr:putative 2OG-Fe(II) oxygenase [Verrucomicrobiae bacterium]
MADTPVPAPFRIFPGFAVPFAEVELPDTAELNAELRTLFLEREKAGATYRNAEPSMFIQAGVFESRFDLFHWTDAPVARLRDLCNAALFRIVGELNGYGAEELRELRMNVDAWFHVTRPGGTFGLHNHPMASWSGVYCVDNGHDGEATSGELMFQHPASTSNMFMDLAVANLKAPWGIAPKSYLLKPGQLVMFPSWVLHQVLPYQGPRERITVAFNAWFRRVAPGKPSGPP